MTYSADSGWLETQVADGGVSGLRVRRRNVQTVTPIYPLPGVLMDFLPEVGRHAATPLPQTRAQRRSEVAGMIIAPSSPDRMVGRANLQLLPAALAEAEAALRLLAAADTVLDEIAFLLRRLRTVTVAAMTPDSTGTDHARHQDQVFRLVSEISTIGSQAACDGVPLFGGALTGRQVWVGSAGQPVPLDLPVLDGRTLGIENPWGHANRASGLPARLEACTGTLPSGIFRVDGEDVYDESGNAVGTYRESTVSFTSGVSATFDRSLYYRDSSIDRGAGTFTLNSVLSVRNKRAAEQSLQVVGDALALLRQLQERIAGTRQQLSDAIIALDIVSRNSA